MVRPYARAVFDEGSPIDDEALVRRLLMLSPLIAARVAAELHELGLTNVMASALWSMDAEGTPLRDLASRLSCDRSNVTLIAERLELAGLCQRTVDPSDGRVRILRLTENGEATRGQLMAAIMAASGLSDLSEQQRSALAALLARLGSRAIG
jgi:DNA-binding MarR family transcriptional regulator